MWLLKLCIFIFVCRTCCDQHEFEGKLSLSQVQANVEPSKCNASGTTVNVEVRLPFMDMELLSKRRVHLLHDQHRLLALHGHELFHLLVGRQNKQLINIGKLAGQVQDLEPLGAAIVTWRQYLLIVVALEENVEIYQITWTQIKERMNDVAAGTGVPLRLKLIQQFSLPGKFKQLHLIKPTEDRVLLLLAVNFTKLYGKYKTFEWLDTYFNPVEEFTVPAIRTLHILGTQPKYMISGRSLRSQSRLVLTVYELDPSTMKLLRRQALTVEARDVLAVNFRGRNYLIACGATSAANCFYFRMIDGQFVVYRKHAMQNLHFTQLAADEAAGQVLVAARQNGEVRLFNSAILDCYSGFISNDTEPSNLIVHRNTQNETFVLLGYERPFKTIVRMAEVNFVGATLGAANADNMDDLTVVQQHRHEFEETINRLRSLLLRRKTLMDSLQHLTQTLQQSKLLTDRPVNVLSGHMDQVRLDRQHLRSPTQLVNRMEKLRQTYGMNRRSVRSFGVGNATSKESFEGLRVRRLHVHNLIYDADLLPGHHLDNSTDPNILTVKCTLRSNLLHTRQLLTPTNYNREQRSLKETTHVQQLHVQSINNVSWADFYDSLFLRGRDVNLSGRLIVQADADIVNLWTPLLNELVVHDLFNLKRPQVVTANISMSAFFASEIEATRVNELNFAEDIVFRGDSSALIRTPVRINQISVADDILIGNNDTKWARASAEQPLATLQQYYTGRVTISGSLTINNLQRDSNATRILIASESVARQDLQLHYLMLHAPQNISSVVFGNAKVTAPTFSTDFINGHRTEEHLLSGSSAAASPQSRIKPLYIIFMNATVYGDIISQSYTSKVADIARNAIRHGDLANVTGVKRFEAPIVVEALQSRYLNDIPLTELVLKSQLNDATQIFSDLKIYDRVLISEQLYTSQALSVQQLNGLPLENMLRRDYKVERLELPETALLESLAFKRINGIAFDEVFDKLHVSDDNNLLLLRKDLLVEGNVRFEAPVQVHMINNIQWNDYLSRLARADANARISGRKIFLADVTIMDSLRSPTLNKVDLSALFDNTLLRATPQAISGAYSFEDVRLTNMDAHIINGVSTNRFVDTLLPNITLEGDVYIPHLIVHGHMACPMANYLELSDLGARLDALQKRQWSNLFVLGDALWNTTSASSTSLHLDYLRRNAVIRTGEQRISGHVDLHYPILNSLETSQPLLNDVDLAYIASDALLKNASRSQTISASHSFLQPVQTSATLRVLNDFNVQFVNDIDVLRFNASLYRRSIGDMINADLNFVVPPIVGHLIVKDLLNGHHTAAVYQQNTMSIPSIRLQSLRVEQVLALGTINKMSLDYLLQNRIPLKGPALEVFGTLSFEQLVLTKQPLLRTINGIAVDNAIYKHGNQLQTITGSKVFTRGVFLHGPVHVMRLNGEDVSDYYKQTIFTDRNYIIESLLLDQADFQGGLQWQQEQSDINGARVVSALDKGLAQQLLDIESTARRANHSIRVRLLYLDYEPQTLSVIWNNTPHVNETIDQTVNLELSGQPASCKQHLLRAEISQSTNRVYLTNLSSNTLKASTSLVNVKVHNYCKLHALKLLSKISITCRQEIRTIGMRKRIKSMELIEAAMPIPYSLLLLNAVDIANNASEVRVLRIDNSNCNITDWQSLTISEGQLMKSLKLGNSTLLLTGGMHSSSEPALSVYRLKSSTQQLEQIQLIAGNFDLAELVALTKPDGIMEYQLLLSCRGCHIIKVFSFNETAQHFTIQQQLRLYAPIDQLRSFSLGFTDNRYLLVLTAPGSDNFYLLNYAHIEGWVERTYGFLGKDIQWTWPLLRSDANALHNPLLMLRCGDSQCELVRAYLSQ